MTDIRHSDSERTAEHDGLTRRGVTSVVGGLGVAALSGTTVTADTGRGNGSEKSGGDEPTSADISVIENPKFITNAQGDGLPEKDELVFDTAPVSIPLDRFVEADDEYDSTLFQSLNDSRQLVVKPPEGYDRDSSYEGSWPPLRWSDISGT